jgi:hypothetical protein
MITEAIFYNPNNRKDCAIQNVTNFSLGDMAKLIISQEEQGRTEYHERTGYPVYCKFCEIFITLSPIERPNAYCDKCGDIHKDEINSKIAESLTL